MADYELNDTADLRCTFKVSGAVTDPTTISLTVRAPSGTSTTYTYAAATVTRTSEGVYHRNTTLDERGVWFWRWAGTGTCQAAAEGTLTVKY